MKKKYERRLSRLLSSADDRLSVQTISIKNLYTVDLFQNEALYKCRSTNRIIITMSNNRTCHLIARACICKCECEHDSIHSGWLYIYNTRDRSFYVILSFMNCAYQIDR